MTEPRDDDPTRPDPDETGRVADAYSPPPKDPVRRRIVTGVLVLFVAAVVVFFVLLALI